MSNNSLDWKHVFNSVTDSVILLDTDGIIKDCNTAFMKLVNIPYTQIIGSNSSKIIDGGSGKSGDCHFLRSKRSKKRESATINKFNKWLKVDIDPILDEKNKISGFVQFVSDITDSKQADDSLKKEKEYYHTFITALNDWVWEMDLKGIHTYSNSAVESILGYKVDEVVGHHVTKLWIESDKQNDSSKILEKVLSKGKGWKHAVGRFQHKDGAIITTESSAIPIYNSEKKIIGYRGVDHDITERIKAELALKESEIRFRSIFSNISNIAVQGYDKDRKVTFWNKASEKLYGYSQKEAINKKLEDLIIPTEMRADVISMIYNWHKKNIQIPNGELILMKKDNSPVHVFSSHVMIEKSNGEKEMFCIDIDITERKQAEDEIKLSSERLTMLNKIVRHDISNDFVVIQSAINIFRRESDLKMLDEIESRVEKSLKTIDNYKKYEAFINSNADLDEIEIAEKIKNIITDFPKIQFNVEGECKVFADEVLDAVFANLISNSIKHGKAKKIDIKISSKDGLCEIRFIDNGRGIPNEIKDKIFDEGFFHGKDGHTGIGLHIVKKTIKRYGGYIYVEDNKPKGVVFVISLRKVLNITQE